MTIMTRQCSSTIAHMIQIRDARGSWIDFRGPYPDAELPDARCHARELAMLFADQDALRVIRRTVIEEDVTEGKTEVNAG